VQCKRSDTSSTNSLYNKTISEVAGTTISGATNTTDWESGSYTFLEGTGEQGITIDLGSGAEIYLKKLAIRLVPESETVTFGAVTAEVSDDDTNWVNLGYTQATTDSTLYIYSPQTVGIYTRYLRFTFHGTTANTDRIVIEEIEAYRAVYPIDFSVIRNNEIYETASMSAFAATTSAGESGCAIRYQIFKNNIPYYYSTVDAAWKQVGTDTTRYDEFSTLEADINTHIGSLITGSDDVLIGVQVILVPIEDSTPAISELTIT
jgi:hypothetical protein